MAADTLACEGDGGLLDEGEEAKPGYSPLPAPSMVRSCMLESGDRAVLPRPQAGQGGSAALIVRGSTQQQYTATTHVKTRHHTPVALTFLSWMTLPLPSKNYLASLTSLKSVAYPPSSIVTKEAL